MVVEGPLAPRARVGRTTPLTYWIHNRGDDTGRVDLVSITGSPAFTITSNGAPATLAAGDSLRVEIAFAPLTLCDHPLALQLSGEGVRSGILVGDTALAIAGLGVAPMLSARDRIIDFGTAAMGSTIDTVTTDFILNADPANPDPRCVDTVTVNAATISGVDAASFRIVSIGVPTTLEPGGPLPVTLEFTPTHAGINTALLEIRFDDATDSVLRITLVGNAGERPDVSVGLSFGGDHATEPGRTVRVPLILGGDIAVAAVDSLVVEVAYHRSLLRLDRVIVPAGTAVAGLPTFGAVNAHSLVTLANPAGIAAGTVAELEFTVLYGGVLVADVFADSAWAPSRSEVVIFSDSASVSIEEFCYANERRLSFGGELLVRAQPNPARDALVIEYELPASGETHLALYDASGRIVTVLVDGAAAAGRYARSLETRDLAAGTYYCVLRAGRFERTTIIRLQK
jgi:hypothetical protein